MNLAQYIPKDFNNKVTEVSPGIFQKTFILPEINYDFFEKKEKAYFLEILERLPEEIAPAYKIQLYLRKSINNVAPLLSFKGDKFDYLRKEHNNSVTGGQISPYKKEAAITISVKAANIEKAKTLLNLFYQFLDSRYPGTKESYHPMLNIYNNASFYSSYFISENKYGKLLYIDQLPENKEYLKALLEAKGEMFIFMNIQKTNTLLASGYVIILSDSLENLKYQEGSLRRIAEAYNIPIKTSHWNQKKAFIDTFVLGKEPLWKAKEINSCQIMNVFDYETCYDFGGIYYGKTVIGNKPVMSNIKSNRPGISWIFGSGGVGNSMAIKNEALQVFLTTQDNIVFFSLHKDYREMTKILNGQVIDLTKKDNEILDITKTTNRVLSIEASYNICQDMSQILLAIEDFIANNKQKRTWIYLDDIDFMLPAAITNYLEIFVQQGCPVTCVVKNMKEFLADDIICDMIKDSPLIQINALGDENSQNDMLVNLLHLKDFEEKYLKRITRENALLIINRKKKIFLRKRFLLEPKETIVKIK